MNHSHGILIFGFCFFTFLIWLWKYPNAGLLPGEEAASSPSDSSAASSPDLAVPMETVFKQGEVDNWLSENGLESLQGYMKSAGMCVPPIESDTELGMYSSGIWGGILMLRRV